MVDITVPVPDSRVPEFFQMYGAWLSGQAEASSPSGTGNADGDDGRQPWSEADVALVAKLWEKFSDPAKAMFSKLIDEPDRRFTGEELAEMLNIPNGQSGVAGVLAWPGKYCKYEGRKRLWEWRYPADGESVVYWIAPEVAALLRQARDREG
jgi:Family of unknown function (DUF6416)